VRGSLGKGLVYVKKDIPVVEGIQPHSHMLALYTRTQTTTNVFVSCRAELEKAQ
jgi:hypothetical protein